MLHEAPTLADEMNRLFEQNYALAHDFAMNPQEFLNKLVTRDPKSAEQCFNADNLEVCCIDGRLHQGNVAIAGSGCLFKQPVEAINYAKQTALEQGKQVTGLTSHKYCGAAGLKQIDAEEFAKDLSLQVDIPYSGHLPVDLPEFHDEVVIYYSGTSSLGLQHLSGLPRGFRLSRRYYPSAQAALYETNVAIQIAFGEHGLGKRFTEEKPLLIVALGVTTEPQFSAPALALELAGLASDKIKIIEVNYLVKTAG